MEEATEKSQKGGVGVGYIVKKKMTNTRIMMSLMGRMPESFTFLVFFLASP